MRYEITCRIITRAKRMLYQLMVLMLASPTAVHPTVVQAQTVEWAQSAGGTETDNGYDIAVVGAGNSYVTGNFEDTAIFGSHKLSSVGGRDIFVAKYDAGGNVLWARSAGGTAFDRGQGIAADDAGNIFLVGYSEQAASVRYSVPAAEGGLIDIVVAKYDGNGNLLWAVSAGGAAGDDRGHDIAVDSTGNCYVTGYYEGTAAFGAFNLTSSGGSDVFVVKYDGNGNVLWVRSAGGATIDLGQGIAVDPAGNSYVTGGFDGTAIFGPLTLTSSVSDNIFVAKYDADGNILWAQSAVG